VVVRIGERYDVNQRLAELERDQNLFMPQQRQMPAVNPVLDQHARQLEAELARAQAQDRRQRQQDHQRILAQQMRDNFDRVRRYVAAQPRAPVPPEPIVAVRAAAPAPASAAAPVDRQEMLRIIGHAERRRQREQHMEQLLRAQQDDGAAIDAAIQRFRQNFPRRPQNPNPQP